MKSTSTVALTLGLWMFNGWGWGVTQAAEPSLGSSFKDWCQKRTSLSAEARKTVEELLKEAGTSDCELAAKDLSSRTVLSLPEAPITDLRPLAGLTNLKDLYLTLNEITDVTPLARLTNLETLVVSANPIADVTPLAGLTNLAELDLQSNKITDVSPLAGLINLKELRLNNNQIKEVSPLARLTNLWVLYLSYNQITDISSLAGLTNLRLLNLTGNPIAEQTCPLPGSRTFCDFENSPWVH
jgi:internalin A